MSSFFSLKPIVNTSFIREYLFLKKTEFYSRERLEEIKFKRLKELCLYAYKYCSYYTELFRQSGLNPEKIQSCEDIKVLPLLTKDIIRNNLIGITSKKCNIRNLEYVTTGGSTGEPLGFYLEKRKTYARTYAYEWRQYNWGHVNIYSKKARIRGKVLENELFKMDKNVLFLSAFHLTANTASQYIRKLEEFQPEYIEAYPSAILILSEYIIEKNMVIHLKNLKSIFLSSETVDDVQKKKISLTFCGAQVFNKYGNCEQVTMIGQCPEGELHEFEEYSYTEILQEDRTKVKNGIGSIVGTSFVNFASVFIRYKTDDLVEVSEKNQCKCGRQHRIIDKIVGRNQDYLLGKDCQHISVAAINSHSKAFEGILGLQYYQEKKGKAIIRVVAKDELTEDKRKEIIQEASYRSAESIQFQIKQVQFLEKNRRGKNLYVVRKCDER